jgi:iron complex outermembrane receptor protein
MDDQQPSSTDTQKKQQDQQGSQDIVVTAQRANETQVVRGGSLGALGFQDAMETPFSVKSYSETLILNQQPYTLGQVLENDPSVRSSLGYGNASETFVIRGFPLYGEDIAIDGLFGIAPRQLISPELYDQVQILNGASAFLFGAAPGGTALGGTVNLVPKRAKSTPITRITANYLSDSHVGGAFDFGRRFGSADQLGIRVNGAGRWGDVSVQDEYRGNKTLGASFDFNRDRFIATLDLAYQRVKVQHMRPMVQLGAGVTKIPDAPPADLNYGQDWNFTTLRDIFGILKLQYSVTDNILIYGSVGARDGAERGNYQGFHLTDATTGAAYVTGSKIPRNDNNEAAQGGVRANFNTGGVSHEINLGASRIWQENRNAYGFGSFSGAPSNLYEPVQVPEPDYGYFKGGNMANPFPISKIDLGSIFASDTVGILDDWVKVIGGLRRQNIHIRSYSYATGDKTNDYDKSATTPVVGLVVRPTKALSFYANRIEALVQGPSAPAGTINVGEIFPPYRAVQYEAGAKVSYANWFASMAVYQTDRPQAFTITNGSGQQVFTADGLQRNQGIEFSVNGEFVHGLRVIAGAAINSAKQKRTNGGLYDGNDALGVPKYTANADVEWDLRFIPGLTLTGRVMQTGEQYADQANKLRVPEWTRLDIGARYVVAASDVPITFRAGVDNVTNERYWASALGGYLVQGLPRTFKLSATVDF